MHQIVSGEASVPIGRIRQTEEIDTLIEYLCTGLASWLYVNFVYFVRIKMFTYRGVQVLYSAK